MPVAMNAMPIEVMKFLKLIITGNFPTYYKTLKAEEYYNDLMKENEYGNRTEEIATHFWWAVKRHLMYKAGELKKDEWQKGAEDFHDFFNLKQREMLLLTKAEMSRIPREYKKAYYFHILDHMIKHIEYVLEKYNDPNSRCTDFRSMTYEYFELIPAIMRDDYFRERCKKYTKEEIENKLIEGCQEPVPKSDLIEFKKTG